jgi:predicted extracellular nuclease
LLGLSVLAACRGDSKDNGADAPGSSSDGGSDGGAGIRIQDIQGSGVSVNAPVEVRGVIVTAIDTYGARKNDLWVEEPEGGPFSGVHVFNVPKAQVDKLAIGDVVDITGGVKEEFKVGQHTVTEIGAPSGATLTVTKTGTAAVPAPATVNALTIGQKATAAERDAEWEQWEGVLITLTNVTQFSEATMVGSSTPDATLQSFKVTGGMLIESGLAAFPDGVGVDACIASATGVLDDISTYFVLPRSAADIALGGTACPPKEDGAAACGDGIDNDGSGFKDCDDNQCIVATSTCRVVSTIEAIQATAPTKAIELQNVYVTGVALSKKSFWVSTDIAPAPNNGVFVFRSSNAPDLDAAIVPGAKVNVIGTVSEFNDDMAGIALTEVNALQVSVAADSPVPPVAPVPIDTQTAATLLVPATAPQYESVLVKLSNVAITALGTTANGSIATAKQNGTELKLGPEAIALTAANLGCYESITGVWTSLQAAVTGATTKPNIFGFIPLSLGPVGTACN